MPTSHIQAIDVHAHYGKYARPHLRLQNTFASADAATVEARARQANTQLTIVSPLLGLMPRGEADAVAGNREAAEVVPQHTGLRQWVIVDPRNEATYRQAEEMLGEPHCVGIKIHPEEHLYPITEHGRAIFEFAAGHKAVVLTHSGEQRSLPADFVTLADEYSDVTLILAHIGCGWDDDLSHQVRAIQASRHGNIYADTSSSRSIVPNLIEWAVQEVGADRVLYGTDAPLYSTAMQRARIDSAELDDAAKKQILRDNAIRILALELD
jgi:predicted TIM-barrel fold metal-dependent hydrolase